MLGENLKITTSKYFKIRELTNSKYFKIRKLIGSKYFKKLKSKNQLVLGILKM
jgi:hypothetical protein